MTKKSEVLSIKVPETLKHDIEIECEKTLRTIQQECIFLLAEAVHRRKFNIRQYLRE
jgi:hypothetical protein